MAVTNGVMQAAAANSATAGMEAATAKKMLAEFQAAIITQVGSLEQRLGVDAADLAKVRLGLLDLFGHVTAVRFTTKVAGMKVPAQQC